MQLSVVIPTWQEAEVIGGAVRAALGWADEVVVADAGSTDGTARLARAAGARVVRSQKGRGHQLHAGALACSGDVLFFLHADARVEDEPRRIRAQLEEALQDPEVAGGNLYLRFVPGSPAATVFAAANHLRRRWLGIYYGDSGLFLRRSVYAALGGFRPLPIFEDHDLVRRLEARHRTVYLEGLTISASARRFARSPARTLGIWGLLQGLYAAGVPAERLARLYADIR